MEINEIKNKLQNREDYAHCGLFTAANKVIVTYNGNRNKTTYADNVKKILNVLQNPELQDGVYIVKCKQVLTGGNVDEYYYNKGSVNTTQQPMNNTALNLPQDFAAAMEHPAIKLQTEITRLELENEDLNRQIDELNEYVAELEGKINSQTLAEIPQPPTAFETAKSFLTELATMAAPIIDQHYQLKAQQIELERARLNQTPPAPSVNSYQAPEVKKERELENKVKAWINSKSADPELFNNLTAIYYNSPSLTKFAELLNDFNTNLYEECKQAVR